MKYLLDTNVWVQSIRATDVKLIAIVNSIDPDDLVLSKIVLGELLFGAHHSGSVHVAENLASIEELMELFPILTSTPPARINMLESANIFRPPVRPSARTTCSSRPQCSHTG